VPLLRCQEIVAERSAAVRAAARAGRAIDWQELQRTLNQPPFAPPVKPTTGGRAVPTPSAVGEGFRAAAEAYERSLRYTAELDDSDRAFCYVSKAVQVDAQCLQRLYTSDRTYREVLRNAVLTGLQDIEGEAGYLARCAQGAGIGGRADAAGRSDGVRCDLVGLASEERPTAEMERVMEETLASFERLLASYNKK